MENGKHLVYEFGGFQLDPERQKLFCQGHPVALSPKVFETLLLLVRNHDRTLLKDELMRALWTGTFVEEANLSQNIFLLRKALGDDRNGHSFIHTVPRRGYRFVAPVTEVESESIGPLPGARDWEYWKQHSPFRSLTVFEEEDAWLFFGREAETADLVSRVEHSAVVAVVGNSGSGKSSLLRAGLIPALRVGRRVRANGSNGTHGQERWRIAVFRPSAAPFDYLAEVLAGQLAPELSVKEQAEFIADCRGKLPAGGDALRNAISALVFAADNHLVQAGQTRVLLVVDQFEELFTLTHNVAIRDHYIDSLLEAAGLDGAVPVHLVLSLRADFFGHCLDNPRLRRCLETSFNLGSMTPEQMRETIEKRLQLAGGRAEPGLIDSLLEDVGAEPGNLALLEHALGQLWEQCSGPACLFTNCAYVQMGRLRGALGRHADEVLRSLDRDQQAVAQKIFLELVHLGEGAQDTRRRVAKSALLALGQPDQIEPLLARLASSRLIAIGREGEETFVEVSHEALIREWPALREWLAQNREELALERRLAQATEEWENLNLDPGSLLQGARLAQAEDWLARHPEAQDLVRIYVQASIDARREAGRKEYALRRRELRRSRWLSWAMAFLLLAAVGFSWLVYRQRVLEKSRAMAGQAEALASRDRGQALDLAIRSWQTGKTEEARLAVARIFPQPGLVLPHQDAVYYSVFSPDDERILSAGHENAGRLWNTRDGRLLATLPHSGPLNDGEFSEDGKLVATASEDKTARVWDGSDGHLLFSLRHPDKVMTAKFSPDGKRIVTGGVDHMARIWDLGSGRLLFTLSGHSDAVNEAVFSPDGLRVVTASTDKTARIWNASTGQLVTILRGHLDGVFSTRFSPDNTKVVTSSNDGTARVWDVGNGRLLAVLTHQGAVAQAVFSPDGRRILTAGFDGYARIWSVDGGLLAALKHDGPVQHVEFSPDGRRIATASFDRTARIWSADGRLLALLQGHTRELFHIAFSSSGKEVVTGSSDHTVRTWRLDSARSTELFRESAYVQCPEFSRSSGLLAYFIGDRTTVRVRSAMDGHWLFDLKTQSDALCKTFSPDGQKLVTASADGTASIWSARDGSLLQVLRGHRSKVLYAEFSPDGNTVVTASQDRTAGLWNAKDGSLIAFLHGHSDEVSYAFFSTTGDRIVSSGKDHTARLWNARDGRLLATIRDASCPIDYANFSRDGQRILARCANNTAQVWSVADARLLATLRGHTAQINSLGFSPDSLRIVTAGADHTIGLWDRDGKLVATLRGHENEIWGISYSTDGQRFISASADDTARVWATSDGRLLHVLEGHTSWIVFAAFLPDQQHILTTSYDQSGRVWEIVTLNDIERILSK